MITAPKIFMWTILKTIFKNLLNFVWNCIRIVVGVINFCTCVLITKWGIAQLGEHLTGSQGVRGSSPLISTI